MISKRVTSFFRRITVCLTVFSMIVLFALSCQKDDGIKQKDPNALTKAQAKEYFEQNARTLKFFTSGLTPAGTKNLDCSLTENMIIEWEQAIEGNDDNCYYVEVPVIMANALEASVHEGLGQYNTHIKKAALNISLLISCSKGSSIYSHRFVSSVGNFSNNNSTIKYPYSCSKGSFSGYVIFSTDDGVLQQLFHYENNHMHEINLNSLVTSRTQKIDKFGKDLPVKGLCLTVPHAATKGDGGLSSGEDNLCPYCFHTNLEFNGNYYHCSRCNGYIYFIEYLVCPDCLSQIYNCLCVCGQCGFSKNDCVCIVGDDELCRECGQPGCNGRCQQGDIPYCDICDCLATQCHCGQYTVCPICGQLNCNGNCDHSN